LDCGKSYIDICDVCIRTCHKGHNIKSHKECEKYVDLYDIEYNFIYCSCGEKECKKQEEKKIKEFDNEVIGEGRIVYNNGEIYEGSFKGDNVFGKGKWIVEEYVIEGEFTDFKTGKVIINYSSGSTYKGITFFLIKKIKKIKKIIINFRRY
jgi:hypothetical protein